MAKILLSLLFISTNAIATTIAYDYIVQAGNQNWGGALGMDFDVLSPITITSLGAFDSGGNGLSRDIRVYLYSRDTQTSLYDMTFIGTNQTLVGGARFADVPLITQTNVLTLPTGFRGTIVAEGYGPGEFNGNGPLYFNTTTLNTGGGLIAFVGSSRYGLPANNGQFPINIDVGPPSLYAAGTFRFQAANDITIPESSSVAQLMLGLVVLLPLKRYVNSIW